MQSKKEVLEKESIDKEIKKLWKIIINVRDYRIGVRKNCQVKLLDLIMPRYRELIDEVDTLKKELESKSKFQIELKNTDISVGQELLKEFIEKTDSNAGKIDKIFRFVNDHNEKYKPDVVEVPMTDVWVVRPMKNNPKKYVDIWDKQIVPDKIIETGYECYLKRKQLDKEAKEMKEEEMIE